MHAFTNSSENGLSKYSNQISYDLIWSHEFLKIYHSKEGNFLKMVWSGLPGKNKIIEGGEAILKFVEKFGCTKLINDISQGTGLFTEAVDWLITSYAPKLNASGVHYVAWIYDENSITRFSADAVQSRSITDTITIVFDNLTNAERWILSV